MNRGRQITDCLVCSSGCSRLFFYVGEAELRQCSGCGFVFLAVQLDWSSKTDLNRQRYEHSPRLMSSSRRRMQERDDKECLDQIENFTHKGRLLDIGCATGQLLTRARERGWDVWGIELDQGLAAQAATKVGSERIHVGTSAECSVPRGSVHVVVMRSVLEHLPDPRAELDRIRDLLTPDGRIFVLVPNIESFESKLYGPRWFALTPGDHLWFFSPATLRSFLQSAGFSDVWSTTSESFRDAFVGWFFAVFVAAREVLTGRKRNGKPAEAANERSTGFVGSRVPPRVVNHFETGMEVVRIVTLPLFAAYGRILQALGRGASIRGVFARADRNR